MVRSRVTFVLNGKTATQSHLEDRLLAMLSTYHWFHKLALAKRTGSDRQ